MLRRTPQFQRLTDGNVFVAWEDFRPGTSYDIYGRVFFPNGTALGGEFIVNQITTNNQWYPAVTGLANGNVFVALARRSIWSVTDIYGRFFFSSGRTLGSEFLINQITTIVSATPQSCFVQWKVCL